MQACATLSQVPPTGHGPAHAPRNGLGGRRSGTLRGRASRRRTQGRSAVLVRAVVAAPVAAEPTAVVTLKATRRLQFGQVLKVVGGTAEMGDWNPSLAPIMNWSEGDVWWARLEVPAGRHEFKFVVANGDGSFDWEDGPNRSLQVLSAIAASGTAFTVSCDDEPGVSALSAFNGFTSASSFDTLPSFDMGSSAGDFSSDGNSAGANGSSNGGSLSSLAATLLRIEGYVADGVVTQDEAANYTAEQLDSLIRKRIKDREQAAAKSASSNGSGGNSGSSAAKALSRWAGLAPSTEEQVQREERKRLEEERRELEERQAELLARAASIAAQRMQEEAGGDEFAIDEQEQQQAAKLMRKIAETEGATEAPPSALSHKAEAKAAAEPARPSGKSKWAALRESQSAAPEGRTPNPPPPTRVVTPPKPVANAAVAATSETKRPAFTSTAAPKATKTPTASSSSSSTASATGLEGITVDWKTVAGVVGGLTAGAGAVLLAASVEVANPDGSRKPNRIADGLKQLGVPVEDIRGKVGEWTAEQRRLLAAVQPPSFEPPQAFKAALARVGSEADALKERATAGPKYAPLAVSPEMEALKAKSFGSEESKAPAKPAAASTPAPAKPPPATTAASPAPPKPAAPAPVAATKPAEAPKAEAPAPAAAPAQAAAAPAPPPPPKPAAVQAVPAPQPAPKPAPAPAKAEAPKPAPTKLSSELEALKAERFASKPAASTSQAQQASKPQPAAAAAAATKASDGKGETGKTPAGTKQDAKPKSSGMSAADNLTSTALAGTVAASVIMAGVLATPKDFDLLSALRFRKPLTDKELAELRAKELEAARVELAALKEQLRRERAEAMAAIRELRTAQQQAIAFAQQAQRGRGAGAASAARSSSSGGGGSGAGFLGGLFGGGQAAAAAPAKRPQQQQRRGTQPAQRRGTQPAQRRGTQPAQRRGTQPVQPREQQRFAFPSLASVLAPLVFVAPSMLLMPDVVAPLSVVNLLEDPEVKIESGELPAVLEDEQA